MSQYSSCLGLLAIEVDLSQVQGGLSIPTPLDRDQTEALTDAIAADLSRLLKGVEKLGLAVAGAVYDQTQVLRPSFPLFAELYHYYERSLSGGEFVPQCLSLGAENGSMASQVMQPESHDHAGPLLLLPFLLFGPEQVTGKVADLMEQVFIEKGQADARTALKIEELFGLKTAHVRYMTVNDLCALLQVQLEHLGLAELWTLLEAALYGSEDAVSTVTSAGNQFYFAKNQASTAFLTFNQWVDSPWASKETGRYEAGNGYAAYLRMQRQFSLSLAMHGIPLQVYRAPHCNAMESADLETFIAQGNAIEGSFFSESVLDNAGDGPCLVTEHSTAELGPCMYTLERYASDGTLIRCCHWYPIAPAGLAAIQEELKQRNLDECRVSYPGKIVYEVENLTLTGDPDLASEWH